MKLHPRKARHSIYYLILWLAISIPKILDAQTLLYEETFSDSVAVGFDVGVSNFWSRTPDGKGNVGATYWGTRDSIKSASGGGAIIFNSDFLISDSLIDTFFVDTLNASLRIEVPAILPPYLTLELTQYYRSFEDSIIIEGIRPDATTETLAIIRLNKNLESAHGDKLFVQLDSEYFSGAVDSVDINLRFIFSGYGYFYIFDDVRIWGGDPPHPATSPAYMGDSLSFYGVDYAVDCDSNAVAPDELVIEFDLGVVEAYKAALRDTFDVVDYEVCQCAPNTELWRLGPNRIPGSSDRTSGQISVGLDESVASASTKSGVQEVDPNYLVESQFQFPESGRPLVAPIFGTPPNIPDTSPGDIIIGVLDSGIDYNHDEISQYIWRNSFAKDQKFWLPDYIGWNFIDDHNDPNDDHSHGTHVSGIIIDSLKNKNIPFKILPVKTHDQNGVGTLYTITCGLYYAVDVGAKFVNASLSWPKASSEIFKHAMVNAGDSGVVVVAAAGNHAIRLDDCAHYPANYSAIYPHQLTVASVCAPDTNYSGKLDDFSNYSPTFVSVAAPGNNIYSYFPMWNGGKGTKSGTSMATPYVLAEAVQVYDNSPAQLASQIVSATLIRADRIPNLQIQMLVKGGYTFTDPQNCSMDVGITPLNPENDRFAIYPNPFNHQVYVQAKQAIYASGEIQVLNSFGKLIQRIPFRSLAKNSEIIISLDSPPGMYLIKIESAEGSWIQKVIKY